MAALTRVVKLGGSLLDHHWASSRLEAWLAVQPPCATLLVVGGGLLAEAVRELDRRHGLSADAAHQQAVRAMQVNAFMLLHLCRGFRWLPRLSEWRAVVGEAPSAELRHVILDPLPLVCDQDAGRSDAALPVGWQVTSDSIAARVAERVEACELVLLKSTLPRAPNTTRKMAAAAQYVDAYFPVAAARLPVVRAVNLRDPSWPEQLLT